MSLVSMSTFSNHHRGHQRRHGEVRRGRNNKQLVF